jgi:hypothetical protein
MLVDDELESSLGWFSKLIKSFKNPLTIGSASIMVLRAPLHDSNYGSINRI